MMQIRASRHTEAELQGLSVANLDMRSSTKTLSHFNDLFAAAVRPFGFNAFAMGWMSGLTQPGMLFSVRWPGWIDHYAVNGFLSEDIVIDETLRSLDPFLWSELQQRRPGEGVRVFEECRRFGWPDGFTIPVDGADGRRGLVSLAASQPLSSFGEAERTELADLAVLSYRKAWSLIDGQPDCSLSLSAREREALTLVAGGRDDSAIALLMSISTSTAHAHVERAKRRLGANTRAQAVAIAIRAKLI